MSLDNEVKEFYANDIVYRFDKRKKINFGVVVESYEASTDSADELHALQKGQLRVWWFNTSRETIWRQSKLHLISRSVIPGDVVRRLENGKETQRGYCKESKQYACVQIVGTDKVIERVCSNRLLMPSPYYINVAVCLGKKFGRIQNVDQKITMQSKCGSTVEVLTCINNDLVKDYWLTVRDRSFVENFYPGQEVTCIPKHLEQPRWLNRTKSMKRTMHTCQQFTIQKVEPTNIEVLWYDSSSIVNLSELKSEDIKNLSMIEPVENSHLELAERRLLKLNTSDILLKKQDWIRKQSALHQREPHKVVHIANKKKDRGPKVCRPSLLSTCVNIGESEDWWTEDGEEEASDNGSSSSNSSVPSRHIRNFPPKSRDLISGRTIAVEVLCLESKVTVVWQDGTEEKDVPTTQLYYSISLDNHEFFPGEWVSQEGKSQQIYGAVQSVNHLERTATVKWFEYSEEEKKPNVLNTTEMSVYDLRKISKFSFRPGSVVKHVPEIENKVGTVIDSCPEGYVMVQWLDGSKENCWPQNLEFIPETVDYEYSLDDDNESAQVSWETESIESIPGDLADDSTLVNVATRLDFVRAKVTFLKEVLKNRNIAENFSLLKDLLIIYDNSSYLDKLLDTSFFSLKSKHFQVLLAQIKEKAKASGVELRGRLFSSTDNLSLSLSSSRLKNLEKENINKALKLEHRIKEAGTGSVPASPEIESPASDKDNVCIELLSMMKTRMDLAYAEIIARIGGTQALSVMTKASDASTLIATPLPSIPVTPDETNLNVNPLKFPKPANTVEDGVYCMLDEANGTHMFWNDRVEPTDTQKFFKAAQKELKLLRESLPPGVWVRSYANRMDLLSFMIRGPEKTPYEDGLFLFDLQLSADYPRSPPLCHFISYSTERLNPNLYVEGRVCVSLLGTWMGRGTEVWGPNSTLLQLIVSIQGLILVAEPYYNEAGYEKQTESQQGSENSRTYNELVILKLVQSMTEMLRSPHTVFHKEIIAHFLERGQAMRDRILDWCSDQVGSKPEFPLLPVSKGLKLSLNSALDSFKVTLESIKSKIEK